MGGNAGELAAGAIQQQKSSLLGVESKSNAFQYLAGGSGKFMVRRGHWSHFGNRPQYGEEADKLRVLFHLTKRRKRQSIYNIAPAIGLLANLSSMVSCWFGSGTFCCGRFARRLRQVFSCQF